MLIIIGYWPWDTWGYIQWIQMHTYRYILGIKTKNVAIGPRVSNPGSMNPGIFGDYQLQRVVRVGNVCVICAGLFRYELVSEACVLIHMCQVIQLLTKLVSIK